MQIFDLFEGHTLAAAAAYYNPEDCPSDPDDPTGPGTGPYDPIGTIGGFA
jgi:hypothetical protein